MKPPLPSLCLALGLASCTSAPWLVTSNPTLEEVATSDRRWTGVAVSRAGRIFVNYPLWSPEQPFAVGELSADGSVMPYPDARLNSWSADQPVDERFVCVQSVFVDTLDRLWILDSGNPRFEGVLEGAPKLVVVDLERDEVERTYAFGPDVVLPDSYLNDVRVDVLRQRAYLTDSGNGALLDLDLRSGVAKRRLDHHASTEAEDIELVVGGEPFRMGGEEVRVHSDGIALSTSGEWLFFQALTGRTLYRLATHDLRDRHLDDGELGERVQVVAKSGASDGLCYGLDDRIYVSALEHDEIRRVRPTGEWETVIADPRIAWPDSFARGADGSLYFTTARIHEGDAPSAPFALYRLSSR